MENYLPKVAESGIVSAESTIERRCYERLKKLFWIEAPLLALDVPNSLTEAKESGTIMHIDEGGWQKW